MPALPNPPPDAPSLARRLLGARLLLRGVGGRITETEAYGRDDPASHSFVGPRPRNRAMFGPPYHLYVYRIYGLHLCLNIVGRPGEAVLLRALSPDVGLAEMEARRPRRPLCAGPGRLAQALGVTLADDGRAIDGAEIQLHLSPQPAQTVLIGPRIGITRALDLPWRFGLATGPLSRPFPPPPAPDRTLSGPEDF